MMSEFYPLEKYDQIAAFIRSKSSYHPQVAIILGSGLGALAASVESSTVIPYIEIPEWPGTTVLGHQGHLVIGKFEASKLSSCRAGCIITRLQHCPGRSSSKGVSASGDRYFDCHQRGGSGQSQF